MFRVNLVTTWGIKCGIAEYSKFLVDELNKYEDIETKICAITKPDSNALYFIKLLKNIENGQITHIQYQVSLFGHLKTSFFVMNYFPLILSILKFWKRNKIIVTVHEFYLNFEADMRSFKFLALSDKIVVHDKKTRELLEKKGIDKCKIAIIPQGTPKGKILDKKDSKKILNINNSTVLTIFGFVHKNKGHDLIVDILPRFNEDIVLLVAGEPRTKEHEKYYGSLKEKVNSLGLNNRIKFLNFVKNEDLPLIFGATDLIIFPYRTVITSAALPFALSHKIPALTSDLDHFKDIKKEYGCIELFERENKEDLFKKIGKLLDDNKRQELLKKKCEDFYEKTSWEKIAAQTVDLYSELINQPEPSKRCNNSLNQTYN